MITDSLIFPTLNIVEELPGVRFIRGTRSTLAYITKLLAANNLGHAVLYKEHHSDGTGCRQVQLQNCIIRIPTADGYKTITLSSAILSVDETSEAVTEFILRTFREGRAMILAWREVTAREFPGRQDLLDIIGEPEGLTLAKLAT